MKALVWPVKAGLSEIMKKRVLTHFEMKGLRKILQVSSFSWTAKKKNEWILNKAGVKRELLDTVKARKLAYYGHTMRKQRPRLDNIKTWTGLSEEESIRMTQDTGERGNARNNARCTKARKATHGEWRKYVHGVANPRIEDG